MWTLILEDRRRGHCRSLQELGFNLICKTADKRVFPSGLVGRARSSQCGGPGLPPPSENYIPCAAVEDVAQPSKYIFLKKKKKQQNTDGEMEADSCAVGSLSADLSGP